MGPAYIRLNSISTYIRLVSVYRFLGYITAVVFYALHIDPASLPYSIPFYSACSFEFHAYRVYIVGTL